MTRRLSGFSDYVVMAVTLNIGFCFYLLALSSDVAVRHTIASSFYHESAWLSHTQCDEQFRPSDCHTLLGTEPIIKQSTLFGSLGTLALYEEECT